MGRYSVKEAVWFAAAVHAYLAFKNGKKNLKDFCLTASELQKAAQYYTDSEVQSARVYQHYNGDHTNHTERYLRRVRLDGDLYYRVTAPGEFNGVKEHPDCFYNEKNAELTMKTESGAEVTYKELTSFIAEDYISILNNTFEDTDIDYIGVLDYLKNNQDIPYKNPNSPDITNIEKEHFEEMKTKGQWAVAEMKKMANNCKMLFDIDTFNPGDWLDGTRKKTRKYLWTQLKYKDYFDSPISVSIFVEKENTITRYRISLEIKNDNVNDEILKQYHSHLEIPLSDGMTYATHVNEWGNPITTSETAETLKKKIESGEEEKVQICIYVTSDGNKTNGQIDKEVTTAVGKLIPYYKHVLGLDIDDEWWPSLDQYNPGISADQWIKFLSVGSQTSRLEMLNAILKLGGSATCTAIGQYLEKSAYGFTSIGGHLGRGAANIFKVPIYKDENGKEWPFTVPFLGKNTNDGLYEWKLRDELKEALESMDLSQYDINDSSIEFDKNMILYGPPGTGKTYNTVNYAVAIIEGKALEEVKSEDYSDVKERFEEYKNAGQIAFTTFHQSYGYEEFIEGIKPNINDENEDGLEYTIESGIFKSFCDKAQVALSMDDTEYGLNKSPVVWKVSLESTGDNPTRRECLENNHIRIGWDSYGKDIVEDQDFDNGGKRELNAFINKMRVGDIVLSCYSAWTVDAIGVVTGEYEWHEEYDRYKRVRSVRWLVKGIDEDIMELTGGTSMTLSSVYQMKVSVADLLQIVEKYTTNGVTKNNQKNYVFIIDEINRGNISKIFGELITLIENTKRIGAKEEMTLLLPYSGKKPFGVPNNVYILGTMNTADRSIALMDTALRRRFSFEEMMPNPDVLVSIGADKVVDNNTELNVAKMLDVINRRIEYLYDREHTIGHAFFTGLKDNPTIENLASIFEKSVIPLLQEYFYEDYSKIQLVLGDNAKVGDNKQYQFIRDEEMVVNEVFAGVPDIEPETRYSIQKNAFTKIESYKLIGKGL